MFDPLGAIGLVIGPSGLVNTSYSADPYIGLARLVSASYVLLPRLGLLGARSHSRVSKGVATAGVSAKVSNHSPSGCLGMTNGARVVTAMLTPTEQNYDIYERELLAIMKTLAHWRQYLIWTPEPFTILTNHANLLYWKSP